MKSTAPSRARQRMKPRSPKIVATAESLTAQVTFRTTEKQKKRLEKLVKKVREGGLRTITEADIYRFGMDVFLPIFESEGIRIPAGSGC